MFDVSISSSESESLSLSKRDNDILKLSNKRLSMTKNMVCPLNINSIRNKIDTLVEIEQAFDISLISE